MSVQLSSIIGANVYQKSDAPRYTKANCALLGVIAFNLVRLCAARPVPERSLTSFAALPCRPSSIPGHTSTLAGEMLVRQRPMIV